MNFEIIKKYLENQSFGWAKYYNFKTGYSEVVQVISINIDSGESFVLQIRADKMTGDVSLEESGKIIIDDIVITDYTDIDLLLNALPKPWMQPIINIKGLDKLKILH